MLSDDFEDILNASDDDANDVDSGGDNDAELVLGDW